MDSARKEDKVF